MLRRLSISFLAAVVVMPGAAIAQTPLPSNSGTPATVTAVLPPDSPGMLLLNTRSDTWRELDRFNPLPDLALKPLLTPFFPAGLGLDDVEAWLGTQVAIALLPITSPEDSLVSNAVLLAPTTKAEALQAFVDKMKAFKAPNEQREYQGVTILQWSAPPPPATDKKQPDEPEQSRLPAEQMGMLQFLPPEVQALAKPAAAKPENPTTMPPSEIPGDKETQLVGLRWTGLAIAQLPGYLVAAADPKAIEKLIDAQAARSSLNQSPLFQRTRQHAQFERSLLVGYGEYAGLLKLINNTVKLPSDPTKPDSPRIPPLTEKQVEFFAKTYSTFDILTWVRSDGIYTQSNAYYTTPQPDKATPARPDTNQILEHVPATTYFSTNGRNFKQQWQEFVELSEGDEESEKTLKLIRDGIRSATGLDLDRDVLAWLDGQYALCFFPTRKGFFNEIDSRLNLGIALMLQTSDRPAAESALKKLDQYVKSAAKPWLTVANRPVKGRSAVSWETKDRGRSLSLLSHSWVNDDTVLITTGIGVTADLTPKPASSLPLNYTFRTATQPFPLPNDGYFYMNMGSTLSFIAGLVRAYFPEIGSTIYFEEGVRVVSTVRSISSSQTTTADRLQADALWVMGTVKK